MCFTGADKTQYHKTQQGVGEKISHGEITEYKSIKTTGVMRYKKLSKYRWVLKM